MVPLRTCPVSSNAYIPSVQTKRLEAVKGVRVGSCGRILRSVPVLQPLLCARTQPAQSRSTITSTCKLSVCDVTTQGSTEEEPKLARHPTFSILQISALVQESALDLKGALLLGMLLIPVEPAEAALINNVPEWAQNIFGFLYLAFFGAFIIRVFRKRAKFATTTRLADEKQEKTEEEIAAEQKKIDQLTPLDTFGGAFVAYSLASIFYAVSVKIDDGFARQPLPADYSIQQITITIRTIVSGLAYLATFVFGANATGLAALGVQLIYKQLTGQLDQDDEPLSGKKVEEKLTSEPETEGDTAPTTLEAYLAKKEKDEANKSVK